MAKDDRKDAAVKLLQEGVGKMGFNVMPFIDSEGEKQIEISYAPKKKDIKMDPNMMHNIMEYFDKAHSLDGTQSLTDDGDVWERFENEDYEYATHGMTPQEHLDRLKGFTEDSSAYRDAVIVDFQDTMEDHSVRLEEALKRSIQLLQSGGTSDQNTLNDIQFYKNSIEGLQDEIDYIKGIDEAEFRLRMQTLDKMK